MDLLFLDELVNNIGAYLKDSKDVIIALLAVIFTIYIPFLLYFYQEINGKDKFKYLDLYIFHNDVFVLKKVFGSIIFLVFILLFWNSSSSSNYFWINIEIILLSIFPFWFFIRNLFGLYELNENLREEKDSKKITKMRLKAINELEVNQENFYIFKDILQNKNLESYNFTHEFLEIFFDKISSKVNNQKSSNWKAQSVLHNLLILYKDVSSNTHTLLDSFQHKDFILILNLYKVDNQNKYSHLSGVIMDVIISMIEKIPGNNNVVNHLQNFLEKENDNFRFKFLSHFHSSIFNSKIILEDSEFMEHYGKEIFNKYNSISGKLQNGIFQKLINLLWKKEGDYNHGYDNILRYWLLNFEPILFTELLCLYFVGYGDNRALSILETKRVFGGIGRVKTYWDGGEKDVEIESKKEQQNTMSIFCETFKNNTPNFDELISQFQKLEKNEKLSERDILKSKSYINLLRKLKEITKKHEK